MANAAGALRRRLAIGIGSQSMPRDGQLMATTAILGTACGASTPATKLMGATAALLQTSGDSFRLPERDVYERTVASLRAAVGEARYGQLTMERRAMPDDAITAEIHAILDTAS